MAEWSAPFSKHTADSWAKHSKEMGCAEVARKLRRNLRKKKKELKTRKGRK